VSNHELWARFTTAVFSNQSDAPSELTGVRRDRTRGGAQSGRVPMINVCFRHAQLDVAADTGAAKLGGWSRSAAADGQAGETLITMAAGCLPEGDSPPPADDNVQVSARSTWCIWTSCAPAQLPDWGPVNALGHGWPSGTRRTGLDVWVVRQGSANDHLYSRAPPPREKGRRTVNLTSGAPTRLRCSRGNNTRSSSRHQRPLRLAPSSSIRRMARIVDGLNGGESGGDRPGCLGNTEVP